MSLVAATLHLHQLAVAAGSTTLFDDIYAGTDVIVEVDPNAQSESDDPFEAGDAIFSAADVAAVRPSTASSSPGGAHPGRRQLLPQGPMTRPARRCGAHPDVQLVRRPATWTSRPSWTAARPENDDEIVLDLDSIGKPRVRARRHRSTVATDEGIEEFTLVGTVRFGEDNALQGATLAFVTDAAAHHHGGHRELRSRSRVIADDGADPDALVDPISRGHSRGHARDHGRGQGRRSRPTQLETFLNYINIFAIAFALISLFVGAYIIVNTFRIIVTQRTREFGLLRAIGATGKQIRTMILLRGGHGRARRLDARSS